MAWQNGATAINAMLELETSLQGIQAYSFQLETFLYLIGRPQKMQHVACKCDRPMRLHADAISTPLETEELLKVENSKLNSYVNCKSGSTGRPIPIQKRWKTAIRNATADH